MKRLVYAPKAFVYVRTDTLGVVNLTDYVISGSVNRLVDATSTAEISIRNPKMKWTEGVRKGNPIFRPMDPITIWLQRIRGYPVQVFTGYLDRTPYLQLYPGPCTLAASCTLKRLQHLYWDPALPFVNTFMQEYGWTANRASGQLVNEPAEAKDLIRSLRDKDKNEVELTDGSIGNLLFAVLKHVANWDPKEIHIDKLPPDVVKRIRAMFEIHADDAELMKDAVSTFISKYIGEGAIDLANQPAGNFERTGNVKGADKIIPIIANIARDHNIPPEMAVTVPIIETGLGENMNRPGAPYWGWYQININGSRYLNPGPYKKEDLLDLGWACNAFCDTAVRDARAEPHLRNDIGAWARRIQGVNCSNNPGFCGTGWTNAHNQAKALLARYDRTGEPARDAPARSSISTGGKLKNNSDSGLDSQKERDSEKQNAYTYPLASRGEVIATVADHMGRAFGNWMSDNALDIATSWREKTLACEDGHIDRISGSWVSPATNPNGYTVYLNGDSGNQYAYMHHVEVAVEAGQKVEAGDILGYAGSANNVKHLHFATKPPLDPTDVTGGSEVAPGGGNGGPGGPAASMDAIFSTAKATAFVAAMEFPGMTETIEAESLWGHRSLLNDKPLLPFVQQLTGAAMRSFQSLPNGHFYAFYPDYFGNLRHSTPYWLIDDVEILDAGIDLSDDGLATHVFAIGDVVRGASGHFNRLFTHGVVNLYNVVQAGFSANERIPDADRKKKDNDKGEKDKDEKAPIGAKAEEVIAFLQKYGARPHVEDFPMIRSPYFELFHAHHLFDLLWSRQFLTEFTFTFMPELFPGGIVGFPDHGVQCYIDQVTHSFDYEGGFQTTASLSAPATLNSEKIGSDPLQFGMVRAASGS